MGPKRPEQELRALNRAARTAQHAQPPTDGITGSAEELAHAIDNITMQTLNHCAIEGAKFHIHTRDIIAAVVARIQGTPQK